MSAAIKTAPLPVEWQTLLAYVRSFVAERRHAKLHNADGLHRRLIDIECEIALQAVLDLLAEQEFIGLVRGLP